MKAKGPAVEAARRAEAEMTRPPRHPQPPLPEWLEPRDYQLDAVERVVKEYQNGAQVVMLDAPVGSGKTAIAELVRRELDVERGLYVCTTKSLQAQVERDFEYARVLKGRANYTPTGLLRGDRSGWRGGINITCGDCDAGPAEMPEDQQTCTYCSAVEDCPYKVARREATAAPLGVLNTSYLLAECNGPGRFRGRELVVADESDLLEGELLGFVELRLGKRVVDRLKVEVPKKGSHMTTIRKWLKEEVAPKLEDYTRTLGRDVEGRRERERVSRLMGDVQRVVEREDGWVRENDEEGRVDSLVLKPVHVADVGERFLWRHGERWLLMSGTTVSAEHQAEVLGLEAADIEWGVVDVPMMFPKENRRVVYVPAGLMTKKGQEEGGLAGVLRSVERVLGNHPEVNVLIHTHTYKLAQEVSSAVGQYETRPVFTYTEARERDHVLGEFKKAAGNGGGVLVAASMDRGVDLPGDLCRVQVVVKMPMASLGSRQVGERVRGPGGDAWYTMQTVRSLLQMCGRAVRGMDDWAVTYVLDEHFSKVLKDGKRMGMFPTWWLEGLEVGRVKDYV